VARPPIYLDHHATTPVDPRVLEAMLPYLREDFGNAASTTHVYGWRAEAAVEDARQRIAACLGAEPREVVFTSGATESNNLALFGAARARAARRGRHVLTAATEHPAVLDPVQALAEEGFETQVLPVGGDGLLAPDAVADALRDDTAIVSVMAANNEIGVLQPLDAIGERCRERGAWLHTDAAQAVGRIPIDFGRWPVELLSVSGHKTYGPKGVGALLVRARGPRVRVRPLLYGGGHERGLRSGTLAVPLVVGMARALELCVEEMGVEQKRLEALRDELWERLRAGIPDLVRNGHESLRLAGNLNVSIPGIDAARLLPAVPEIAVSTGSACSSARPEPSHVLLAIGCSEALARASLRFGLGRGTRPEDVARAAARVVEAVQAQRS